MRQHLVIIRPSYLGLIASGRKTVECRASMYRCVPFSRVSKADLLLFKLASGAVVASCTVLWCRSLVIDTPSQLQALKAKWANRIKADRSFWDAARSKRYWTLIGLGEIHRCQPFCIEKRDRRAWVVLNLDEPWWQAKTPLTPATGN